MDELVLLRGHDRDVAAPSEEVLARSRSLLTTAMDGAVDGAPAAARRRRSVRRAGPQAAGARPLIGRRAALIGVGAFAVTGAGLALFASGAVPTSTASAAETLRSAASAARASQAPVRGVRTRRLWFASSASDPARLDADGQLVEDQSVVLEQTTVLRRTTDGSDWVRTSNPARGVQAWGKDASKLLDQVDEQASSQRPTSQYLSKSDPEEFWNGPDPARIRALPREPAALLERLATTPSGFTWVRSRTGKAFYAALDVLGSGLADAELQAATYRALELLPDLQAAPGADVDGRRGVAITFLTTGAAGGRADRVDLVVDPSTGRFLGYTQTHRQVVTRAPVGSIESAAAYSFDV